MADKIEFEEPRYSKCDCCDEVSTHLVRFVSRDNSAFAVYFADFTKGHEFVSVQVGFGDWWTEDATPQDRTAISFRIWTDGHRYQVGLVDASSSMYSESYLGKVLDRDEALIHPLKQEVFDLSDHIVECDQPIIEFLNGHLHD